MDGSDNIGSSSVGVNSLFKHLFKRKICLSDCLTILFKRKICLSICLSGKCPEDLEDASV